MSPTQLSKGTLIMYPSDMEGLLLENLVMGEKVTPPPPVVLGASSRFRKQREPLSHPLEQMLAKSRKPHHQRGHSGPSNTGSMVIQIPEQGQQSGPTPNLAHCLSL